MSRRPSIAAGRLWTFYLLMGAALLVLAGRLWRLQIYEGEYYAARAQDNREQDLNLPAPRGVIYDRNGVQLVRNVPSFNVTITPAYLPDSDFQTEQIYARISALTGVPVRTAQEYTEEQPCGIFAEGVRPGIAELVCEGEGIAPYTPVYVAKDIPRETAFLIRGEMRELPGVDISVLPLREYPIGPLVAQIVGYMGPIPESLAAEYLSLGFDPSRDKVGYAGVEASMQATLAGRNGHRGIEVDVAGQEIRTLGEPTPPRPGDNIVLTIDVRLQAAAEAALRHRINFLNTYFGRTVTSNGVVIAMNPQTGEILAMVSWPTYDNNRFARLIPFDYYNQLVNDPARPLFNHAIGGEYPPGSVYKIVAAVAALEEGVIDPERRLFDPGIITITNRYFPNDPGKARNFVCWKREGHGWVAFVRGIAESCDVYFYKITGGYPADGLPGMDIDVVAQYAHLLGYGQPSGIELPGEQDGLVPTRDWKRINMGENWATGDTYIAAIGQGFVLSTPLQVLNSIAAVANGGTLYQPTVVREIVDGEGNVVAPFTPKVINELPFSQDTINWVRKGMLQAVVKGTATDYISLEGISVAGKTGTAEYCDDVAQQKNLCQPGAWPAHAWFVGYAPYEKPEIAVVAFVYNGGEGAVTAGPIVNNVLRAYFDLKEIDAGRAQ